MKRSSAPTRGGLRGVVPPGRHRILAAYRDGVTVICELAAQFTDMAWLAATPCTEWRAVDLAGHLRCRPGGTTPRSPPRVGALLRFTVPPPAGNSG